MSVLVLAPSLLKRMVKRDIFVVKIIFVGHDRYEK